MDTTDPVKAARGSACDEDALPSVELGLIVKAMRERYGYDFRNYERSSLLRRVDAVRSQFHFTHLSELIPAMLWDRRCFEVLLQGMLVGTTSFFRNPAMFALLANRVLPLLANFGRLKIWHAGCSSGEEVYSLAMLLDQAGLLPRCTIYATDIDNGALDRAKSGIYSTEGISEGQTRLQSVGIDLPMERYFQHGYGHQMLDRSLRGRVTFAHHNLVTDGQFGEMHLVMCRNVMIYFDEVLEKRVVGLLQQSVRPGGFLCLGDSETLRNSPAESEFETFDRACRVYRRRIPGEGVEYA